MTAFPERFATLEGLLGDRRSTRDEGWPQKLHLKNASTTLVSTAQVLEILRIRGVGYEDPTVQGGLRYLAEEVKRQIQTGWTRYPAYALWGLMRYPAVLNDPQLAQGAVFSYKWLKAAKLAEGGWGEARGDGPLWLPATMVAVHALDRLALYTRTREGAAIQSIANEARTAIARVAEGSNKAQLWWTQFPKSGACPGTSGLAVLALARGSEEHRKTARAGISWLAANPNLWSQHTHTDDRVESRVWRILSFSVGLRSLLHPCAPRPVTDPTVTQVVEHFDALWNDEDGGWAEFAGGHASTTGSYAVVSAVHTLKRAWPFDPMAHLGLQSRGRGGRVNGRPRSHRVLYIDRDSHRIRVENRFGEMLVETTVTGPSQWTILITLAERQHAAAASGSTDQNDMTVSLDELAELCSSQPETISKTAKRLNEKLAREAKIRSQLTFVDLIEDHVPAGTSEKRLVLEEIEVRFEDASADVSGDSYE